MKTCADCKIEKDSEKFGKNSTRKDGLHSYCKGCVEKHNKKWYEDHTEERAKIDKQRYENNKPQLLAQNKQYREEHKKERAVYNKQYKKERLKNDPIFRLVCNIRTRLCVAIKNNQKAGSAIKDLGCSVNFLKGYLEAQLYDNPKTGEKMSWQNYGWHIDHIFPLSYFDLTDREQFLKACHFSNLQPLWAIDNFIKSDKS